MTSIYDKRPELHPNWRSCNELIPAERVMVAIDWPGTPSRKDSFVAELLATAREGLLYCDENTPIGTMGALQGLVRVLSDSPSGDVLLAASTLRPMVKQDEMVCPFSGRVDISVSRDWRGDVARWECPTCGAEHEEVD